MPGETDLITLIRNMTPHLNEGEYVFTSVNIFHDISRADVICELKEPEGTSVVLAKSKADEIELEYDFVASWITLMVDSSLHAVGLTSVVATELAKYRISCNVIAGYYHDHLFVHKKDELRAMEILHRLSESGPADELSF